MGLTHFLCGIVTQRHGSLRLRSRFWRKAASGHSVSACNPSQAFSPLQMPLLLMLVSHFLHHLLSLSQQPARWVLLHLLISPAQSFFELLVYIFFQLLFTLFLALWIGMCCFSPSPLMPWVHQAASAFSGYTLQHRGQIMKISLLL